MIAASVSFLAAVATMASVVAPKPSPKCATYDDAYARAPLMTVLGLKGSKVHLQDQPLPCQQGATCPWVRAGYVVAGDQVFASGPVNGFRCVYVGATGKLSAGFVPNSALRVVEGDDAITPAWLIGRWSDGNDIIVVSKKEGELSAEGDGIWPGRNFAGPPGPNFGSFQGAPKMAGDKMTIEDGPCRVDARRRGPYLIVSDNENCGGMNVRFKGIYVSGSTLKP